MPINDLIDELIEKCGGDVHAALKALLLINDRLEAELEYLYRRLDLARRPNRHTVH